MNVTVNVFDPRDMKIATDEIAEYLADLQEKGNQICERLASIGALRASIGFSSAIYPGVNDVSISVEPISNGWAIHARGNAVLFIEFGAGATLGYGHPEAKAEGYGPGTYNPDYPTPENPNWRNPKGWWYGDGQHTYGNPPAAAMYYAKEEVIRNIEQVAREVFGE